MLHAVDPLGEKLNDFFKVDKSRADFLDKRIAETCAKAKTLDYFDDPKKVMTELIEASVEDYNELAYAANVFGIIYGKFASQVEKKISSAEKVKAKLEKLQQDAKSGKVEPSKAIGLLKKLVQSLN